MKKKMLLIVNPKAGKGTIEKKLPKIIKNFSEQGYEINTCYTRKNYSPYEMIEENKEKMDLIVCCGGDGTLNQVINAIMKLDKKPDVSFIPLGTVNDFARTIKMSTKKTFLSKNINETVEFPCDIGSFNGKYFNYVAAFGAFTQVPYVTPQKLKKIIGKIAYFVVAIRYIPKIKSYEMKLKVKDEEVEDKFIFGSVSNSKSVGGFEWFKRSGVKLDDGKFEMLFVKKPKNPLQFIDMVFALLLKKHDRKYFKYFQTDEITIEAEYNIPWTLDGEYGGRAKTVNIKNNKQQVTYVVPR